MHNFIYSAEHSIDSSLDPTQLVKIAWKSRREFIAKYGQEPGYLLVSKNILLAISIKFLVGFNPDIAQSAWGIPLILVPSWDTDMAIAVFSKNVDTLLFQVQPSEDGECH
jgi:hypothetical protein